MGKCDEAYNDDSRQKDDEGAHTVDSCGGMIEHDEWAVAVAGGPGDSDGGTGGI